MALILLPPFLPIRWASPENSTRSSRKISFCLRKNFVSGPISRNSKNWVENFSSKVQKLTLSGALALGICLNGPVSVDAKVGVNKPELLPEEFSTVIDVAGFLSAGQETRLRREIADLEKDTGYKLRVLAQNYPETPGNILNFNVGASIDLDIPTSFWSRLAGKYGNIFYWKEQGEDASIEAAVKAIATCLREPVGRNNCSEIN